MAHSDLERGILRERVKARMDRARRQGKRIGHPGAQLDRKGFAKSFGVVLEGLNAGSISRSQAAKELKIGYAT